jgi:hypothetical protein
MNNHNIEKEIKLAKLKDRLWTEGIRADHVQTYEGQTRFTVNRQTIREFICGTLNITDPATVRSWIDFLVNLGIFEHNPDSQKTKSGLIRPSNDTRYYVHFEKCAPSLISNYK